MDKKQTITTERKIGKITYLVQLQGEITSKTFSEIDRLQEAVSYTHLDVYKRQIHIIRLNTSCCVLTVD